MQINFSEKDLGLNKIKEELEKLARMNGIIKLNPNLVYSNGMSVSLIGFYMEYGSDELNVHYPSRPFFRQGVDKYRFKIIDRFEYNFNKLLEARMSAYEVMEDTAKQLVEYLKENLQNGEYAPLSEKTIMLKGSDKPLIDTGLLLSSIIYEIKEG